MKTDKIFLVVLSFLMFIGTQQGITVAAPVYIQNYSQFPGYPYNTAAYMRSGAYAGCGPTTGAMILGYYQHVNSLPTTTGLLTTPGTGVNEGLETAWVLHGSAYMNTGTNGFGSVYDIEPGLENYATNRGYEIDVLIHASTTYDPSSTAFQAYGPYGTTWLNDGDFWTYIGGQWGIDASKFCDFVGAKLAAGVAIFLTIDTNLDGSGDHWVALVGYDKATLRYAFYDTYSTTVQWADVYYCGATPRKDNSISYLRSVTYIGPIQQNNPPRNLVALNSYHSAVPLAWNKPQTTLLPSSSIMKTTETMGEEDFDQTINDYLPDGTILNSFDVVESESLKPTRTVFSETALTGYHVYRATSSGGPYTRIASNVTRQYYRDTAVNNGTTYFYKVTAVYSEGESGYSNTVSALPALNGYVINSNWSVSGPTMDGVINASEWSDAAQVNMLFPGAIGTVTLYVMNCNNILYLAIDDKRDTHRNHLDQIGIFFDEDLNREWPPSGSSITEGNFWVAWDSTRNQSFSQYGPRQGYWPDNLIWPARSVPAGVGYGLSNSSGNIQYEASINIFTSPLNTTAGSTIGVVFFSYDYEIRYFTGFWPQQVVRLDVITPQIGYWGQGPFSFGNLKLASGSTSQPDIEVTPLTWNYGSVNVGSYSDHTFVVRNTGTATLNISSITLEGDFTHYSIVSGGGSASLAPGGTRNVVVRFQPATIGTKNVTARISSNDPDENPVSVTLTGTGTTPSTCSITVTSPNGGESVGCSKAITWTSSNASGNVKIEYYCNDTWHTIISTTPNDGSYTWTVPNNTVCSSKIKISDVANSGCWDMSDNYFNINCTTSCSFTITAPNGGENIGCSTTITWTSSGASGNVKLEYYCGTTWNTIIASTPNDGSYAWTIPAGTVCSSKIKVSDVAATGCWDMSNDYFNINCQTTTCQITVTSPNGGETVGCSHTIRWTSAHASGNVKIEYQCNSVWNVIVNSTPNDGTYDWTIPAGTSCATARVRITDAVTAACTDQSNSNFTISCGGVGPCNPPFIKAGDGAGANGMDIQVPIQMKGNTAPVDAFGFKFNYCADKLNLLEVIKGPLTAAFSFFQFQETSPGIVTIGGFHTTAIPANADGVIAYVRLHVDACTSGQTCVLNLVDPVDDLVGMNTCSGTFTCGIPCKLGDVNNDGSLTPGDALCAFEIYINGGTPQTGTACDNECALYAADVNCTPDGITPGDALHIFQGYLGGMTPPIACKPAALPKESGEINVTITSAEGKPGDEVVFTIELDRPESIQAFGIDLGYPAELLTFAGIRPSGMTTGWEVLDGRVNIDGVVTIGGFNPVVPETHNSVGLVDVVFRIHEDADGFGELWLFNFTDDLAQASSRSGRFGTSMEGVRRLSGLEVPSNYHLEQNYPNPFNMDTEIMYQLPEAGYVSVTVYNSVGHQIRSLVSEHHEAGRYAARWDGMDDQGNDIPSGVYIYQIKTGKFSDSKKMILIK